MFIIIFIAEAQQQIVVGKRLNVLVHRRSCRIGIRILRRIGVFKS